MNKARINLKGTEKIDNDNRQINEDDNKKGLEIKENVKTQVITAKKVLQIIESYGHVNILAVEGSQIPIYNITQLQGAEGFGKIAQLLDDDMLEEIMHVPGKTIKVVHRKHGMCDTTILLSPEDANIIVKKVAEGVNKKIDFQNPLLDARLPDGSRVNATVPPASPDGTTITIRKFLNRRFNQHWNYKLKASSTSLDVGRRSKL
jgi:flagellar protein FlaI